MEPGDSVPLVGPQPTRPNRPPAGANVLVGSLAAVLALVRMLPPTLVYEEPTEFWDRVSSMDAPTYLVEPWAGYFVVFARAVFLIAHPFDDLGPLLTRLASAAVIGVVAGYFASDSLAEAIPAKSVRLGFAASLPLLPLPYPGPYIGPLNSQWWVALGVLGIALSRPRRWHLPALFLAGLVGIAPCLAWPIFRDRRVVPLLAAVGLQALVLLQSNRGTMGIPMSPDYLWIMLALTGSLALARLPVRTRLAFLYLGLAVLTLGGVAMGQLDGQWRYLAIAGSGIVVGVLSIGYSLWSSTTRSQHAVT